MKPKLYFVLPFILQSTLWRILMRPFFYLFTGFKVEGLEHLKDLPRGVIFAPNHSSELDSILLPLAFPLWSRFSPMFYIVREPKFYTDPVFAWRRHFYDFIPFNALGAFSIVSGLKDYALSLKKHVEILRDGGAVCIFPEGGFSTNGTIGKAHGGVGFMAHASQKPVVPVLIQGTAKHRDARDGQQRVSVTFLPAVSFPVSTEPSLSDFQAFGERVLSVIRTARATETARVKRHADESLNPIGKDA